MDAAFAFNTETGLQEIRMSAPVNAENGAEETESNLLHELVHWRLFTLKLPFDDVNDEFIAECLRVGAPLSGGTREKAAYERYLKRNGEAA
jgi:SprT-like protein